MKISLPGVLVGLGGVGGVVGTVVGVTYHGSEVEESRDLDNKVDKPGTVDDDILGDKNSKENNDNDSENDSKFTKLKEEIKEFADDCKDKNLINGRTILEDLEDIFKTLLGPSGDNRDDFLKLKKPKFKKRLDSEEESEKKKRAFEDLYKRLEEFSKSLENNEDKSAEYIGKLGSVFSSSF